MVNKQDKNELKEYLIKCSNTYYNTGNKIISDSDFDELKSYFENTFKEKLPIGAKVTVKNVVSVKHSYKNLAGTLDKVNSIEELKAWMKLKGLSSNDKFYCSLKVDGNALVLEYTDSKLSLAVTRGDEGVGKDLTDYFKNAVLSTNKNISKLDLTDIMDEPLGNFAIACETYITYSNFNKMLDECKDVTYNNPRSCISGILTEDGFPLSKYLSLAPLKFKLDNDLDLNRNEQINYLNTLNEYGFSSLEFNTLTINDIEDLYNRLSKERFDLDLMIDGLVIEIANDNKRNKLGYSTNIPNFAIALKFPYIEKSTKLKDITWFTEGNSGRYTPVAWFEPVKLIGNTYQKTSLANYARFKALKLRKNDDLIFSLRNEVLGYVDKAVTEFNQTNKDILFKAPTHCTFCKKKLHTNDVFLTCINDECQLNVVGKLVNFLDKNKVKGIKSNIVQDLVDNKLVKNIPDLFNINYKSVSNLDGYGVSSANNIKLAIDNLKKDFYDYNLIGSLNIINFSIERAKELCKVYSINEILEYLDDDSLFNKIVALKGFDTLIANSIINGLLKNLDIIFNLIDIIDIKIYKETLTTNNKSLSFVITGELNIFTTREELVDKLVSLGHVVRNSVTNKTDYLVTNTPNSGTVKNKDAIKLNKPIITESELISLLNL